MSTTHAGLATPPHGHRIIGLGKLKRIAADTDWQARSVRVTFSSQVDKSDFIDHNVNYARLTKP